LPTELVEIHVVIVSIQVQGLEEPITYKFIPLVIPKIGAGVKVTMIDLVTHASSFQDFEYSVKDTTIAKRLGSQLV
jgi:hypothetical protein